MEEEFGIGVCDSDFESCFGRKPKDEDEFYDFAHNCRKAVESQIDWDIVFSVVKEEMEE